MHPLEHPIGVQLADADPAALVEAAALAVERGADLIDLNCGCPVKKVVKTECGAALLKDPPLIGRILAALRDSVPARIPVTLKMRVGWNDDALNGPEVARIAEASGAQAITVHGRTREQLYTGSVRLDAIRAVKEAVRIPVIGNGDVLAPEDARAMFEATGCDGVMIGRGAVGNPWIFRRTAALLAGEPCPPAPSLDGGQGAAPARARPRGPRPRPGPWRADDAQAHRLLEQGRPRDPRVPRRRDDDQRSRRAPRFHRDALRHARLESRGRA